MELVLRNVGWKMGPDDKLKLLLSVLGIVFIIEGLPYLLFPSRMKEMIKYILESDDRLLRIIGVGLVVLGMTLIFLT